MGCYFTENTCVLNMIKARATFRAIFSQQPLASTAKEQSAVLQNFIPIGY
jgi:hypothetical protein